MTEYEALLSALLFEAGERVHATHQRHGADYDQLITCTASTLCQRIMTALTAAPEPGSQERPS